MNIDKIIDQECELLEVIRDIASTEVEEFDFADFEEIILSEVS